MDLLSQSKLSSHGLVTKIQVQTKKRALRRQISPIPLFTIALPYEIWRIILWITLDSVINPLAYCDSDNYPTLCARFDGAQGRYFEEWFQLRLVCRTWNDILGGVPHIVCSAEKGMPGKETISGVISLRCIPNGSYGAKMTDLRHYPQLTDQIKILAFSSYDHWWDQKFIHDYIKFNNVQYLYLNCLNAVAEHPDFWSSIRTAFPQLAWLTSGKYHTST
jgi:hypothetical protein